MVDNHLAVAVLRQRALSNSITSKSSVYCFDESESLAIFFVAMYVNDSYFARDQIHKLAERFFESRLFTKLTKDSEHHAYEMDVQLKKLSIDHFVGAFFVCSLLILWAMIQLFFEIFAHKQAKFRNARQLWILLGRLYDNERYEWILVSNSRNLKQPKYLTKIVIGYVLIGITIGYISMII